MPHCADQEMGLGEQQSPNTIFTLSLIHHPSHFMPALPDQLFYITQIPVCLWFEVKRSALEASNNSRLFDGEAKLSLVV
jgi:hypothetical protein